MATVYRGRGVYYFPGKVKCPLAGVGSRGDYDSNRLVLDDADTEVTLDAGTRRITVRNERSYPGHATVADLMFLAEGILAGGGRAPFGLHLKVMKRGDRISVDLHRHLRSQQPMEDAEFEAYEVTVTDGTRSQVVLTRERALGVICRPSVGHRIVKAVMAMRDNLAGKTQDPRAPGFGVADLSLGFGALGFRWVLVRARLESLRRDNSALLEKGSMTEMLREGAWELKVTAFSERWLPEVLRRDLFLFGLEEQPLLAGVRERGLRKGQTLSFRFERGKGEVALGDRAEELPGAVDVARAYMEFHMLGGLLAERAEGFARSNGAK